MLNEVQTWWQNASPEMQAAIQFGGVILGALVVGQIVGAVVARTLAGRNFDAVLRLPSSTPHDAGDGRGFTPSYVGGLLVRLTIWSAAAWWLAQKHGRTDLAQTLGVVIKRTWAITTILVASLAVGTLLANRLIACFGGLSKPGAARAGTGSSRWDLAGIVGAGVYVLVLLLVLLIAADLFDWPLTRTSAQSLWQFTQHLMVACAALFIGGLGASWAREIASVEGAMTPEKRAGQYTALGMVSASTVVAVAVMLSSAGVLLALAALAILGLLLWMSRGYLPDISAGLQLRAHKVDMVYLDGEPWQVAEIGFISTQVTRRGEFCRLPNRQVFESRLQGTAPQAASR